MIRIESSANPRIKKAVRLRQRSHRDASGLTLVEGYREIRCALEQGHPVRELYFCPDLFLGENEPALIAKATAVGAVPVECVRRAFEKMSYRDRPDGLLALAPKVARDLSAIRLGTNAVVLVSESVEKPGNLGTMLRSADAAGAAAVVVCDPTTDINNPNVIRASLGTLFSVPVAETDASSARAWLRANRLFVVAASPHADTLYTDIALPPSVALVVGSEQYGLAQDWLDEADAVVKIPMFGRADSLNVASSATLLLYEAVRQGGRRAATGNR